MDNQSNLQRLISAATSYGYSDEQIVLICDEIGRTAFEQLVQEMERLFTPEEKHDIENLSKDEADEKIKKLYMEKMGKDPQDVVNGYLARHIDEFIEDHKNDDSFKSP